jgi:hypothetical protein
MTTVSGFTKERMLEIENETVTGGLIVDDDLHLVRRDGTPINAGNVRGPIGPSGGGYLIVTSTSRPGVTADDAGLPIYETDTKLVRVWNGARWVMQERVICTSTTRPAVTIEDEGTRVYETDTDVERTWTGSAWKIYQRLIRTAATRPALTAADEGVLMYETDTDKEYMWDGAAWKLQPRWQDQPRGCLGTKILSGSAGPNLAWFDASGGGLTVAVGKNRRLHVLVNVGFFLAGIDGKSLSVRVEQPSGTGIGESFHRFKTDYVMHSLVVERQITVAGNYTFVTAAKTEHTAAIGMNINWQHIMAVYDMGPLVPALSADVPS